MICFYAGSQVSEYYEQMAVFLKEEIHPQLKSHKADLLLIHQATSVLLKKFISITHDHKSCTVVLKRESRMFRH